MAVSLYNMFLLHSGFSSGLWRRLCIFGPTLPKNDGQSLPSGYDKASGRREDRATARSPVE
ncbi:hypothetical protein ACJ73_10109, partial [Blastomyces percursus]